MTREELVAKQQSGWKRLDKLVREAEQMRGAQGMAPAAISELAELYRGMASDLMRVRRDRLGADLERYLDNLASRAHNALYAGTAVGSTFSFRSLLREFPGAVRRNSRWFWLATFVFYVPAFIAGYAAYVDEGYALAVLSQEQLDAIATSYSTNVSEGRTIEANEQMTGFYVYNNIGIAFRCFATGILLGLGSLFYLLHNAVFMGVIEGHLARVGVWENLMAFTSTHGPWELTAIVMSAAAGMQMGWSLVITHGRTRLGNLQAHGLELLRQLFGVTLFLSIAAMLEAWYSPSSLSYTVKYVSGGVGWVAVAAILLFGGRRLDLPPDVEALEARS